jgi:hypothetical protein
LTFQFKVSQFQTTRLLLLKTVSGTLHTSRIHRHQQHSCSHTHTAFHCVSQPTLSPSASPTATSTTMSLSASPNATLTTDTSCSTSQWCLSLPASPLYVICDHCTRQAMGRTASQVYPALHSPPRLFICHQFMHHAHAYQGLAAAKKNCEGDACLNFFCTNTTGAGRNRRYADGSENGRHRRGSDSVVVVYK